jgi:hypothetical protein
MLKKQYQIASFSVNLLRDGGDLEMVSDDKNDLRAAMQ